MVFSFKKVHSKISSVTASSVTDVAPAPSLTCGVLGEDLNIPKVVAALSYLPS